MQKSISKCLTEIYKQQKKGKTTEKETKTTEKEMSTDEFGNKSVRCV